MRVISLPAYLLFIAGSIFCVMCTIPWVYCESVRYVKRVVIDCYEYEAKEIISHHNGDMNVVGSLQFENLNVESGRRRHARAISNFQPSRYPLHHDSLQSAL